MIEEFDKVKIIKSGVTGIVVDIYEANSRRLYTIESDEKGVPGGWWEDPDAWSLFTCTEDELERIDRHGKR